MNELGAARVDVPKAAKPGKPVLRSVEGDGGGEAGVLHLGWARRIEEDGKRQEHWTEVELVLEMWDRVALSWNNETLMRLSRYARLEAEAEREIERKAAH